MSCLRPQQSQPLWEDISLFSLTSSISYINLICNCCHIYMARAGNCTPPTADTAKFPKMIGIVYEFMEIPMLDSRTFSFSRPYIPCHPCKTFEHAGIPYPEANPFSLRFDSIQDIKTCAKRA